MKTNRKNMLYIFGSVMLWLACIILPGNPCFAELTTKAERQQFILNILKQYSPAGYYIVNTVDTSDAPKGMTWNRWDFDMNINDSKDELLMVSELDTVVHETNHVYTDRMPYVLLNNYRGFNYAYYTGAETIIIKVTKTFPAREIASLIPETLRDFRYQHYIDNNNDNQSTQQQGIFGLLDEFNSYYLGAQTGYDLRPWFDGINQWDWPTTKIYLNLTHSSYLAHGEFKLYILSYLLYAKQKYPNIYRTVMKNEDFKRAFTAIDGNWSKLIADYFNNLDAQIRFLDSKGIKASLWNNDYFFSVPDSKYSYGLELLKRRAEYEKFQAEINHPKYQEILEELQ